MSAPAAAEGASRAGDPMECSICLGNLPRAEMRAFVPCGHLATCAGCAAELQRMGRPCPLCRSPVRRLGSQEGTLQDGRLLETCLAARWRPPASRGLIQPVLPCISKPWLTVTSGCSAEAGVSAKLDDPAHHGRAKGAPSFFPRGAGKPGAQVQPGAATPRAHLWVGIQAERKNTQARAHCFKHMHGARAVAGGLTATERKK